MKKLIGYTCKKCKETYLLTKIFGVACPKCGLTMSPKYEDVK